MRKEKKKRKKMKERLNLEREKWEGGGETRGKEEWGRRNREDREETRQGEKDLSVWKEKEQEGE